MLEPAMGVGHFFGLMPESFDGGHRTGVELDSITARIARKLYPDATIFAQGFEETPLPDNYFDAIVGNVPFGDYAVHDPAMKHQLTRAIHDYFFAKSLEKLRPGGVMALITSRYTMDKQADAIRRHLAEQADLLGAIRLPTPRSRAMPGPKSRPIFCSCASVRPERCQRAMPGAGLRRSTAPTVRLPSTNTTPGTPR